LVSIVNAVEDGVEDGDLAGGGNNASFAFDLVLPLGLRLAPATHCMRALGGTSLSRSSAPRQGRRTSTRVCVLVLALVFGGSSIVYIGLSMPCKGPWQEHSVASSASVRQLQKHCWVWRKADSHQHHHRQIGDVCRAEEAWLHIPAWLDVLVRTSRVA